MNRLYIRFGAAGIAALPRAHPFMLLFDFKYTAFSGWDVTLGA